MNYMPHTQGCLQLDRDLLNSPDFSKKCFFAAGTYQLPTSHRYTGNLETADVIILACQFGGEEKEGSGPAGWLTGSNEGDTSAV